MAKDLTAAWAALSEGVGQTSRQDNRLPDAPPLPAIPERVGSAKPKAGGSGGSGGIASPLVETSYTDRLFFAERTVTTTDGLFAMRIRPINSIKFKDANDADVEIQYRAPV